MSNAFRAAFQRVIQRFWPVPVGSRAMTAMWMHLRAACSLGKCPRARTARRMRAFTLSMALVEQMTRRISGSKPRKGTNSAHAFSHSLVMAGYRPPHSSLNS